MTTAQRTWLTILVASLGYFVDLFDLIMFVLVRVQSLGDLHVEPRDMLRTGAFILNLQMGGLMLGGVCWGLLGDRRGRLSVLLGSITVYSIATLGNAFVTSVGPYAALRFMAGVGLAGELGAGVTIASELLPPRIRGYGSTLITTVGVLGVVAASLVVESLTWRHAYLLGGSMGLALLVMRVGVRESGLFARLKESDTVRGRLLPFLRQPRLLGRFARITLIGVPIWFVIGVLGAFTPEFGRALGLHADPPKVTSAIMALYLGFSAGHAAIGLLSQWLQSRRASVLIALGVLAVLLGAYPRVAGLSVTAYYAMCFALGVGAGYWAMFVQIAAESFGTNYRATVTTSVPNLVRGSTIFMTLGFQALIPRYGVLGGALGVGFPVLAIAVAATLSLPETFHRDLDFEEPVRL
jgi:MFS family permease